LTDWELFQSLASELTSSNIRTDCSYDGDKAACDFAASIASTRKTTILDRKYEIPGLDRLLKHTKISENYGKKPGIQHAKRQ
jgi:hypothetical protein